MTDIANVIDQIGQAFNEYKATNDAALAEVKAKGSSDPVTEAKLQSINKSLDDLQDLKSRVEKMEVKAARPGNMSADEARMATPKSIEHRDAYSIKL